MKEKNKITRSQARTALLVFFLAAGATTYGVLEIGPALLYIIAIPGFIGYLFWYHTYLRKPTEPAAVLPLFMVTIAAFDFHVIEEYEGGYSLAISRIFRFAWTNNAFFVTICVLSGALLLVCAGLYYRQPIAGFIAIMFLVTRLAEIALFIFPFVKPAFQPENVRAISQHINGMLVSDMPTYYYTATGHYYFPGMYTVVLVLIPAVMALYQIWKHDKIISAPNAGRI